MAVDESSVWLSMLVETSEFPTYVFVRINKEALITGPFDPATDVVRYEAPSFFLDGAPALCENYSFTTTQPQYVVMTPIFDPSEVWLYELSLDAAGQFNPIEPTRRDLAITTPVHTHCVGTGSPLAGTHRSDVRWYKFAMNGWDRPSTLTPTLAEWGDLDPGPGFYCFVPSLAVQPAGYAAFSYNATNGSQNISYYTHIKCDHASPWQPAVLRHTYPTALFRPSTGVLRNPDYSGTFPDPTARSRFWMHHMPAGTDAVEQYSWVQRFDGCGADFNGDGHVDGADAMMFATYYQQGAPEADFEPDSTIDVLDVIEYQESGLP